MNNWRSRSGWSECNPNLFMKLGLFIPFPLGTALTWSPFVWAIIVYENLANSKCCFVLLAMAVGIWRTSLRVICCFISSRTEALCQVKATTNLSLISPSLSFVSHCDANNYPIWIKAVISVSQSVDHSIHPYKGNPAACNKKLPCERSSRKV